MKKRNGFKNAVIVMMAAGLLCACGGNSQSEGRGSIGDRPETASETEPAVTSEQTTAVVQASGAEQEKDPDSGNIVIEEVEKVTIRYYAGYNIATGDLISETIPCHTVEAGGVELAKLSEILPDLSKINVNPKSEEYSLIMYEYLLDYYELTINDDLVLRIGGEYGFSVSDGALFRVPLELYGIVESIAEEYNKNNVYETLDTDRITVTSMKGKELEITDPDQLDMLKSIGYYPINAEDDSFKDEKVAYVLDLHNGDQLDIFFASVLGKYRHADGGSEYVYIAPMEDYLNGIFSE